MAKNTVLASLGDKLGKPLVACGQNMARHMASAYTDGIVLKDFSGSKSWWVRNTVSPAVATAELTGNVVIGVAHLAPDAIAGYRRLRVDRRNGHSFSFDPAHPHLMVVAEHSLNRKHSDKARRFPRITNQRTRIATRAYMRQGGYILLNDSADFSLAEKHLKAMGAGNTTIVSNYGACRKTFDANGVNIESVDKRLKKENVTALRDVLGQAVQGKDSLYMMSAYNGKGVTTITAERNASDALDLLKYKFGSRHRASFSESKNEKGFTLSANNGEIYNIVVQPQKPYKTNQEARLDNMRMLLNIAKARNQKIKELDLDTTLTPAQRKQQLRAFDSNLNLEIQFGRDGALVFTERDMSKRKSTEAVKHALKVNDNDFGMRITSVADVVPSFSMADVFQNTKKLEKDYWDTHTNTSVEEMEQFVAQKLLEKFYQPDANIFNNTIANGIYTSSVDDSELLEIQELRTAHCKNLISSKAKRDKDFTGGLENAAFSAEFARNIAKFVIPQCYEVLETKQKELNTLMEQYPDDYQERSEYKAIQDEIRREKAYIDFRTRHMTSLVSNLFELDDVEIPTYENDATIVDQIFKMQVVNANGLGRILPPDEQTRHEKRKEAATKLQQFLSANYTDQQKQELLDVVLGYSIEIQNGNMTFMQAWERTIATTNLKIQQIEKEEAIALHQQKLADISNLDASPESMTVLINNLSAIMPTARDNYENDKIIIPEDRQVINANIQKMEEILDDYKNNPTVPKSQKIYASVRFAHWKAMHDIISHKKNDIHYQERLDVEARTQALYEQTEAIYQLREEPVQFFDYIEEQLNNMVPDKLPFFVDDVLTPQQELEREILLEQFRTMVDFYNSGIAEHVDDPKTNLADTNFRKELSNYLNYAVELMERNVSKSFTQTVKDEEAKLEQLLMSAGAAYSEKLTYDDATDEERSEILVTHINNIAAQVSGMNLDDDKRQDVIKEYESYMLEFRRVRMSYQTNHPVDADVIQADNAYVELLKSFLHLHKIDEFVPTADPNSQEGMDEIDAEKLARAQRYSEAQDRLNNIALQIIQDQKTQVTTINNNITFTCENKHSYYQYINYLVLLDVKHNNQIEDTLSQKKQDEEKDEEEDEYDLPNGRKLVKLELTKSGRKQLEEKLTDVNEIHKELIKAEYGINPDKKEELTKLLVSKYNEIKSIVDKNMLKEYRLNNVAKYALNATMDLHANIGGKIKRKEMPAGAKSWEDYKDNSLTDRIKLEVNCLKEILERGVEVDKEGAIYIKDYKIANTKRDTQEKIKTNVNKQLSSTANPYSFIVEYSKAKIKDAQEREEKEKQYENIITGSNNPRPSNIALKTARLQLKVFQEIQNSIIDNASMKWELAEDTHSIVLTLEPEPTKGIKNARKIHIYESEVKDMGIDYHKLCDNIIATEKAKVDAADVKKMQELQEQQEKVNQKALEEEAKKAKAQKEAEEAKLREEQEAREEAERIAKLEAEKKELEEKKAEEEAERQRNIEEENKQREAMQKTAKATYKKAQLPKDFAKNQATIDALEKRQEELLDIINSDDASQADIAYAQSELSSVTISLGEYQRKQATLEKLIQKDDRAEFDSRKGMQETLKSTTKPAEFDAHQGMQEAVKTNNAPKGEDLYLKAIANQDYNPELDGERKEEEVVVTPPVIESPAEDVVIGEEQAKIKTGQRQTSLDDFTEFSDTQVSKPS